MAPACSLLGIDHQAIASDSRGFVYLWDLMARRVVVVGEPSTVEVDTSPPGFPVMVDGIPVPTPQTFQWLPGEYHTA